MKKANLLVVLIALGILAWVVPAQKVQAAAVGSAITSPQDEADEPAAEESEVESTQVFTGKIMKHEGSYVLHSDGETIYHLDDQEKAKGFDGKNVKVSGTLDEENGTIRVAEIEEMEVEG